MGITSFSVTLLEVAIEAVRPQTVIELGSQNLYISNDPNPPFSSSWYKEKKFSEYDSIDLAGDNNSKQFDLSYPILINDKYDLVTDFGSSEHVVQMSGYTSVSFHDGYINSIYPSGEIINIDMGYYNCWLNKFNLCKVGGAIVSENPKHGHWKNHGYSYIETGFYEKLISVSDLEIVKLGEHGAMGNWETGINVYSVLKKTGEKFPTFEEFSKLPIYKS